MSKSNNSVWSLDTYAWLKSILPFCDFCLLLTLLLRVVIFFHLLFLSYCWTLTIWVCTFHGQCCLEHCVFTQVTRRQAYPVWKLEAETGSVLEKRLGGSARQTEVWGQRVADMGCEVLVQGKINQNGTEETDNGNRKPQGGKIME